MEAATSIVTVAIIGLQSVRLIHDVFSLVKDWPKEVGRVLFEIQQLEALLRRLSDIEDPRDIENHAIRAVLETCNRDMEEYAGRLQAFAPSLNEKRRGRLWKGLKGILNEKALDKMRVVIGNHVRVLSAHIGLSHSAKQSETMDQINRVESRRLNNQITLLRQFQTQAWMIHSVGDELRGDINEGFQSVQATLRTLPEASAPRVDAIFNSLKNIQDQITGLHQLQTQMINNGPLNVKLGGSSQSYFAKNLAFDQAINRLCQLVSETSCTLTADDAQKIIEDIDMLLEVAMDQRFDIPEEAGTTARGKVVYRESSISRRDLKRIRGLLNLADQLELQRPKRNSKPQWIGPLVQTRRRKTFKFEQGTMMISLKKRRLQTSHGDKDKSGDSVQEWIDLDGRFLFSSKSGPNHARVKATVYQTIMMMKGSVVSIPRLEVDRLLPVDSEIFRVVEEGRMQDFLGMLDTGRASLRDYDEFGASLLHYATYGKQVDMVQFLVNHGVDVDCAGWHDGCKGIQAFTTALSSMFIGRNNHKHFRDGDADAKSVFRILVEAGADTAIQLYIRDANGLNPCNPFFNIVISHSPPAVIQVDFDSEMMQFRDSLGQQPIHWLGQHWGWGYDREAFELLLRIGVMINSVDYAGRTALSHAVENARSSHSTRELEALVFLVQSGADIYAKDRWGRSITWYAYAGENSSQFGYRGDLWDAVLARCGFSVEEFRKRYPRRARYTDKQPTQCQHDYTRAHFEQLWDGYENRCPYYDSYFDTAVYYTPGYKPSSGDEVGFQELDEFHYINDDDEDEKEGGANDEIYRDYRYVETGTSLKNRDIGSYVSSEYQEHQNARSNYIIDGTGDLICYFPSLKDSVPLDGPLPSLSHPPGSDDSLPSHAVAERMTAQCDDAVSDDSAIGIETKDMGWSLPNPWIDL